MTLASIATGLIAPAASSGNRFDLPSTVIVIIVVVIVIGLVSIIGWRPPNRSPGIEEKAEREKED